MWNRHTSTAFRSSRLSSVWEHLIELGRSGVVEPGVNRYLETRGYQILSVGNVTATFDATDRSVMRETRRVYRMELEYLSAIINHLEVDDVFYYVGAHVGVHSSFAAKAVTDGTVIAFEPDPDNIEYLKNNVGRNAARADVFELAISNERGISKFVQPMNAEGAGSQIGALDPDTGELEVKTAPLDGIIANRHLPRPDVIKIVVEGAEPLVLDGMNDTLSSGGLRAVFLEVHLPTPHVD